MNGLESQLLDQRANLLAYIRRKVADPDLAEDVLQESLLKALQVAPELREADKFIPWLYRIVTNAIMDTYRRRRIEVKYRGELPQTAEPAMEPEDEAALCVCMWDLIPRLKPEYAELIEELELFDGDPKVVAKQLGIARNNLKVRRHRARQALRKRLEEVCRLCALHSCLDCTCQHTSTVRMEQRSGERQPS